MKNVVIDVYVSDSSVDVRGERMRRVIVELVVFPAHDTRKHPSFDVQLFPLAWSEKKDVPLVEPHLFWWEILR